MRFLAVATVLFTLAWAAPAAAQQKKIQCWNDKTGARMCGDRVPPEYAGQKREVIKDGRVVETKAAAATAEERAAERRRKEEVENARRQADYDRALLETYRSAKDIESMRDDRIAMLDGRIASIEKNAANTDKSLTDLKARAEKLTAEGKPVDEKLAKQIRQFERDQKQNVKSLERNRKERADIETRFNSDLARYQELRGIKPKPTAAAPAATPASPAAPGEPAVPATPPPAPKG